MRIRDINHAIYRGLKESWRSYNLFRRRFTRQLSGLSTVLSVCSVAASLLLLACMILLMGYNHDAAHQLLIERGIRASQSVFLISILYTIVFNRQKLPDRRRALISRVVYGCVLVTGWSLIYPQPVHPWFPVLADIVYSDYFIYPVLIAYAIVDLCNGVMQVIGRRTNPSLLLSTSFVVFICIGTLLLMLPKCTYAGISFSDALFLSTSAVCITGLTPVDLYVNLTPLGTGILAVLIQVGALGVMTFTSFFALFFSGRSSIFSQMMLRDMIYSKTMSGLVPTLLYILGFTLSIEAVGAVMVFLCVHGQIGLSLHEELVFSAFHSLSSFCNAGFSVLPNGLSNPLLLYSNGLIYWATSALVVLGAIGFPILVNFKDVMFMYIRRVWRCIRPPRKIIDEPAIIHPFDMNTKIVLVTFGILLLGGALLFFLLERDNTLSGHDLWWQTTQSVFNSVTPRSAGFSSVNPAAFRPTTLLMVMFLMWVGGASQSTAGGIKVNTLAAIWLNLRCIVTGREKVTAFKRTIAVWSVRRANAVVALSIFSYFIYSMVIMYLEPELDTHYVLFEVLSALFTVGSSCGITSSLSDSSLIVLSSAMFLGRVGIISLLSSFVGQRHDPPISMPTDNLIIN